MKTGKALNFMTTENGVEVITINQAVNRFRRELYKKAKNNLEIIKASVHFVLVSELEKVAGTNFSNYIDETFDGVIHKDEINGVNNLATLVKIVASERGTTEPCIAYIEANGRQLLVVDKCDNVLFFNAEVNSSRDFKYEWDVEKGMGYFGRNPSIFRFFREELEEFECDYKLITKVPLNYTCNCDPNGELGNQFNEKECKGCNFYSWIAGHEAEGKEVLYIKAI